MKQKVAKVDRTEFDREATTKMKDERREDRPKIKLDEIQAERGGEAEFLIIFANRGRIRNQREDQAHQRPTTEKKRCAAPGCFRVTHERFTRIIAKAAPKSVILQKNVVSSRGNGASRLSQGATRGL